MYTCCYCLTLCRLLSVLWTFVSENNMVSTKHCCYGTCNSDSRYAEKPHMQGVSFLPFPKPITQGEKCDRWVRACGRKNFDRTKVTRNTYICTKHFVGGHGPTPENTDPVPAVVFPQQVDMLMRKHKAATPPATTPLSKKQRTEAATALLHLSSSVAEDEESTNYSLQSADEGSSKDQVSSELKWHCACCQYSKEKDSGAAPIKKVDQGTQTIYDKYKLGAKIESIIMKRREAAKHLDDFAAGREVVSLLGAPALIDGNTHCWEDKKCLVDE